MVLFATTTVVETYQEPIFTALDQVYECAIAPLMEFGFAFTATMVALPYKEVAFRWNDILNGARECFIAGVNVLRHLPGLDNLGFYTDIARTFVSFMECLTLLPFETPSWQLPFGITDVFSSYIRYVWCLMDRMTNFYLDIVDYTLLRNDCVFCELDPNATCPIRKAYFLEGHVPPTVGNYTTPQCKGCVQIDCDVIACTMRVIANITSPITQTVGFNITETVEMLIEPTCGFITGFYKRPVFLIAGLITWCIDIGDAPDFIINEWLKPIANYFVDIVLILSQGTVGEDFFLDLFAIIFAAIQEVIDTVKNLISCINLEIPCFNSYPFNCEINDQGVATSGLQTCFHDLGVCIVDGNATNNIPASPLLSGGAFPFLFEMKLPEIFSLIDELVCQYIPIQTCIAGPSPSLTIKAWPNCPGATYPFKIFNRVNCFLFCIQSEIPLLADLAFGIRHALELIQTIITNIIGSVNFFIIEYNEFCGQLPGSIATIHIPSCGGIPTINMILEEEEEGKDSKKKEQDAKKAYDEWEDYLRDNKVTRNTTCGHILYMLRDKKKVSLDEDVGYYHSFFICGALMRMANKYEEKYPDLVKVENFLNSSTFIDEFSKTFQANGEEDHNSEQGFSDIPPTIEKVYENYRNTLEKFKNPTKYISSHGMPNDPDSIAKWSEMIRNYPVNEKSALLGLVDRIIQTEPFQLTKHYYMIHTIITDEMSKEKDRLPVELIDSEKEGGDLRVSDLVPYDDPHTLQLNRDVDTLNRLYSEPGSAWEKRVMDIEYETALENLYATWVSTMINWWREMIDDRVFERQMKRKIREKNWKDLTPKDKDKIFASKRGRKRKTRVVTVQELRERRKRLGHLYNAFNRAYNSLSNVVSTINPDNRLISEIMDTALVKDNFIYKKYRLIKDNVYKEGGIDNITRHINGEIAYDVDNGFISHERQCELKKNRDNSTIHIFDIITGNYNPRRPKRYGPFMSDPESMDGLISYIQSSWYRNVKEMKYKKIKKMGLDPSLPENQNIKVSSLGQKLSNNFIIDILEYIVNQFVGSLYKIFLRGWFDLNLKSIIENFIDHFDPLQIAEDESRKFISFVEKLFFCNIPEDYDGTNAYKVACFPFMYEAAFDWVVAVGKGNPYFPLQLGIVPVELIEKDCVNTFNGHSSLFKFKFSNNCGSNDGNSRPFCDSINCDWCEKKYGTCSDINFDSPVKSLLWFIGIIPVLLQEFYTGVIGASALQQFLFFFYIYILNLGGFNLLFVPYIVMPALFGITLTTNILDATFANLSSPGAEGGISFGAVYVVVLLVITFVADELFEDLPDFVSGILGWGLAITWLVNFFITPFRGIREALRINAWLAVAFEFMNEAPQPLEWINWSEFVEAAKRFDFSDKDILYADTFCFFATSANAFLIIGGAFLMIDIIQGFYIFGYPAWVFVANIVKSVLTFITSLRFLQTKENVIDLMDWKKEFSDDVYRRINLIQRSLMINVGGSSSGRRSSVRSLIESEFDRIDERNRRFLLED